MQEWILLRGLGREKEHSRAFLDLLQKKDPGSVVRPIDLPGAGDYFRVSSPLTMKGIAEFVKAQIGEEKKGKRFLVAISLGGMVAMELATLYPQAFDGVVVINSSFRNLSTWMQRLQPEAMIHIIKAVFSKTSLDREKNVLQMVSNNPKRLAQANSWSLIAQKRPVSGFNFLKQLVAAATYELPSHKPEVPIYVLASEGDRMVNSECSKAFAEHWQLPLAIHPHAGHELYLDDPEWVVEQLLHYCGKS